MPPPPPCVQLLQAEGRSSPNQCIYNVTYGCSIPGEIMWIKKGCRGRFLCAGRTETVQCSSFRKRDIKRGKRWRHIGWVFKGLQNCSCTCETQERVPGDEEKVPHEHLITTPAAPSPCEVWTRSCRGSFTANQTAWRYDPMKKEVRTKPGCQAEFVCHGGDGLAGPSIWCGHPARRQRCRTSSISGLEYRQELCSAWRSESMLETERQAANGDEATPVDRQNRWSVALQFDSSAFDFFLNWWEAYAALDLRPTMLVHALCGDGGVCRQLERHLHCLPRGELLQLHSPTSCSATLREWSGDPAGRGSMNHWGSHRYKRLVRTRATALLRLLQQASKSVDLIYADIDAVWRRDPRPFLRGDYDVFAQVDYDAQTEKSQLCTGFLALRNTPAVMSLLMRWEGNSSDNHNQGPFNTVVHALPDLRVGSLPTAAFPDGRIYFSCMSGAERAGAIIVHNNMIQGGGAPKRNRMQAFGLWAGHAVAEATSCFRGRTGAASGGQVIS